MAFAQLEVISGALEAATSEMCASLIRAAYSPNVKERGDCSTAICDVTGRTLSLTSHAPAHLGSTLLLVDAILERFPLSELQPGDVFFANDPYIVGVTHLNDCSVAAPKAARRTSGNRRFPRSRSAAGPFRGAARAAG